MIPTQTKSPLSPTFLAAHILRLPPQNIPILGNNIFFLPQFKNPNPNSSQNENPTMVDHHQFSSSSSSSSPEAVSEWVSGLPSYDLMPLSTALLPPSLAAAFSVSPEPAKTILDAELAALETVASIRRRRPPAEKPPETSCNDEEVLEGSCSSRNQRRRLVWTPQLHKRFLDVMARLGSKEAVPKKIMEMMNVEGLTREHVASHLQKYQMKFKEISSCN